MRSSKSRSRSKGNRNRSVGNIVNRVFDSSGPEGKVRGTPQQIIDKYNQLARDAQLSNDRVAAENFQQHAEHYLRMLSEAQREQQERQQQHQQQQQAQQQAQAAQNAAQGGGEQPQPIGGQQPQAQQPEASQNGPRRVDGRRGRGRPAGDDEGQPRAPEAEVAASAVEAEAPSDDGGLVETPEDNAGRPRRPRRKPPVVEAAPEEQSTPDAAE